MPEALKVLGEVFKRTKTVLTVVENPEYIKTRLSYLRKELRNERISYGELAELQSLAEHIDRDDTELREAAGIPETTN
jgi:hypothetical protein